MKIADLKTLDSLGEGFTVEFKQAGTSHLGRENCAFANATGSVILIGVTDSGETVGVDGHNRLKSEVQAIARSAEPPVAVEVAGSGIRRIRNLCREYGVSKLRIDVSEHWFTVTFPRPVMTASDKGREADAALAAGGDQAGTKSGPGPDHAQMPGRALPG